MIRLERAFWKDNDFPYYLVTLVPFGPGQSGSGGGGIYVSKYYCVARFVGQASACDGLQPGFYGYA